MTTTNQIVGGTTKIARMILSNHDNTIRHDIRDVTILTEIFEDVTQPTLYGTLLIEDTNGIFYSMPIIGEETLEIDFLAPQQDTNAESKSATFAVYKCDVIRPIDNHHGIQMRLHFISKERIRESWQDVSISWKDTPIEEMIEDILTNTDILNSEKEFTYEETQGRHTFVIPSLPAFDAINLLKKYATSKEGYTSPYLFYEDFNGFNFVSVEHLIKERTESLDDFHRYHFTPSISVSHDGRDLQRIISLNISRYHNSLRKNYIGAIRNQVKTFDIFNKNIKTEDYRYSEFFNEFIQHQPNRNKVQSDKWLEEAEDRDGTTITTIVDTSKPREFRYDILGQRTSFMHLLDDNLIEVGVAGSTYITVGDTIHITFPKMDDLGRGDDPNKPDENHLTGNYFIRAIKHSFTVDLYSMSMQLRRFELPYTI